MQIMKNKLFRLCLTAFASVMVLSCGTEEKVYTISSPGNTNELVFKLTEKGEPQYSFSSNGKTVIEPSLMGFEFQEANKMTDGFEVVNTEEKSVDENWDQP